MRENVRICFVCGKEAKIHAMIDGNDKDFCSEKCIRKYSRMYPKSRITIIERR